jgi:hypothetical protein
MAAAARVDEADANCAEVIERLKRIESTLADLVEQRTIKDWYTTSEVAAELSRAEFTVREWCRLGRVNAQKRLCGRGCNQEWSISHEEVLRIRNHGLIPVQSYRLGRAR